MNTPDRGVRPSSPEERIKGRENLASFFDKIFGPDLQGRNKKIYEKLVVMTAEEFLEFMTRVNGLLISQPIHDRKIDDKVSFVLTESLALKRIKALDILDEDKESRTNNEDERFDADFVLMTAELASMMDDLVFALGGETESLKAA